jgi:hypothetical protein
MSIKALEDENYELIRGHILDPGHSPLSPEKQEMLDRVISASKVLDKNPVQKNAISIHHSKYGHISRSQAYQDIRFAMRLYNSLHTFEYGFWHAWLINDIVKNIQRYEQLKDPHAGKIIAMEHANLIKVLGPKPLEEEDPLRNEKHQFYILIQNDNRKVKIDINQLNELPLSGLKELNTAIWGGQEISDTMAQEIMKS